MTGAVAVLLTVSASGCVGGSRSGSDQPGVDSAPSGEAEKRVSIQEASEDDIAAALRRNDVGDPQGWARIVVGFRPYPPGEQGRARLAQVLAEHGAEPDEVSKITNALEP